MNDRPKHTHIPKGHFLSQLPSIFLIFGIGLLSVAFFTSQHDFHRSLIGYHFAFISVLSIALGAMIFVLMQHATAAGWSVVVRRIFEACMGSLGVVLLLGIPVFYLASHLFPWAHIHGHDEVLLAKAPYLNLSFFYVRSFIYMAFWIFIAIWLFKKSIEQDAGNYKNNTRLMAGLSAPFILIYGLTTSFASFDWVMSLQPHWYSTIFGVYFFAGALLSGIAFCTLVILVLQKFGFLLFVNEEHYHDLGKLLFGFTVFWAYIGFSQFMLYWYANIPEEMEFYAYRLENGWEYVSAILPITNFVIPFFALMSRHVKRYKLSLCVLCLWVLGAHFLDLFWLIIPTAGGHEGPVSAKFLLGDFASLFGILFLFCACVFYLLTKYAVYPMGDPRLKESTTFENA